MPSIPLLHAGQAVLHVTTVDVRLLALAMFAFAIVLATIGLPSPATRSVRRAVGTRVIARAALTVVISFAVLPAVLPYDHLPPSASASDSHETGAIHATHCHTSPGTCSDAPVPSGPRQLLMGEPLIATPAMLSILLVLTLPALAGISRRPEIRPPLLVRFA